MNMKIEFSDFDDMISSSNAKTFLTSIKQESDEELIEEIGKRGLVGEILANCSDAEIEEECDNRKLAYWGDLSDEELIDEIEIRRLVGEILANCSDTEIEEEMGKRSLIFSNLLREVDRGIIDTTMAKEAIKLFAKYL